MPTQAATHCAVAGSPIGHPEFPLAGSGIDGLAQSGQFATCCNAASPSAQDAGDTMALASGAWSAIRKASKWTRKRGMCRR